mmetsp:Transcript_51220/g.120190  ORF Transcript_51220/g.120190 Transcript_51220/m.120190 type:complete len:82 (-) Transcript_51220:233-478(-)
MTDFKVDLHIDKVAEVLLLAQILQRKRMEEREEVHLRSDKNGTPFSTIGYASFKRDDLARTIFPLRAHGGEMSSPLPKPLV